MPLSGLLQVEAYLHMTLHAAIGGMDGCGGCVEFYFCWNDVLLAWM